MSDTNVGTPSPFERIGYLEAKLVYLRDHCRALLESGVRTGQSGSEELHRLLDIERARSNSLAAELAEVRAHRDDVIRQIQHQHAHVLNLTTQLERYKGLLGNPNSLLRRLARRFYNAGRSPR